MSNLSVIRDPHRESVKRIRKHLREMVDGEALLGRIEQCHEMLMSGREGIINAATGVTTYVELSTLRTTQLGKALDVQFRLLAKILPDLKSIELTGDVPEGPKGSRDKMVLATKLLAVWREEDAMKQTDEGWLQ